MDWLGDSARLIGFETKGLSVFHKSEDFEKEK